MRLASHSLHRHAAHYAFVSNGGHDLEQWTIESATQPTSAERLSLGVASDAEFHYGSLIAGVQSWTYSARRPFGTGTCARCEVTS